MNKYDSKERGVVHRLVEERLKAKHDQRWEVADEIKTTLEKIHCCAVEDEWVEDASGRTLITNLVPIKTLGKDKFLKAVDHNTLQREKQLREKLTISESQLLNLDSVPTKRQLRYRKENAHKKKQKARFKVFCEWVIRTFGKKRLSDDDSFVLDVAGGNGGLCWEFVIKQGIKCAVVDPRAIRFSIGKTKKLASLCRSHNSKHSESPAIPVSTSKPLTEFVHMKVFNNEIETARKTGQVFKDMGGCQVCCLFDSSFCKNEKWKKSSIVLGLHPDQATGSIVDCALEYSKPFAVVPCCVFPSLFPHRTLKNGEKVKTREQLILYLCEKDEKIQSMVIPSLPGPCNTVVFWNP